jgi:hypothetical protein
MDLILEGSQSSQSTNPTTTDASATTASPAVTDTTQVATAPDATTSQDSVAPSSSQSTQPQVSQPPQKQKVLTPPFYPTTSAQGVNPVSYQTNSIAVQAAADVAAAPSLASKTHNVINRYLFKGVAALGFAATTFSSYLGTSGKAYVDLAIVAVFGLEQIFASK